MARAKREDDADELLCLHSEEKTPRAERDRQTLTQQAIQKWFPTLQR